MSKKIKIEAIIDLEGDLHVDEALLKRTIGSLGEVESCKIINDFDLNKDVTSVAQTKISSNSPMKHILIEKQIANLS